MKSSERPELIKYGWNYTRFQTGHSRYLHILLKWDNFSKSNFNDRRLLWLAPDQPLDLNLTHSVPLGHQGILQLKGLRGCRWCHATATWRKSYKWSIGLQSGEHTGHSMRMMVSCSRYWWMILARCGRALSSIRMKSSRTSSRYRWASMDPCCRTGDQVVQPCWFRQRRSVTFRHNGHAGRCKHPGTSFMACATLKHDHQCGPDKT